MIIYTTAPVDYDYWYMEEIAVYHSSHGSKWRVLETEDEYRATNYQIPRYNSGLYPAYTAEEFEERGLK